MQHLVDHRGIDAGGIERQGIHVGLAHLAVADAGALQIAARDTQHVAAEVDADAARGLRRQHLEQTAGAGADIEQVAGRAKSEEHTSELQSLMRNSYAVFCLKKKKIKT